MDWRRNKTLSCLWWHLNGKWQSALQKEVCPSKCEEGGDNSARGGGGWCKRVTRFISPGPSPDVASKWEVFIGAGRSDPGRGHWWTKMLPRTWGTEFSLGKRSKHISPSLPHSSPRFSSVPSSLLSLFLPSFSSFPPLSHFPFPPSLPYSIFAFFLKDGLPTYSGCLHTSNPPASACPELRL